MPTREKTCLLVLESPLGRRGHRTQIPCLETFARTIPGLSFRSLPVSTVADLAEGMDCARKDPSIVAVHLIAHGLCDGDRYARLDLGGECLPIRSRAARRIFTNLAGKTLFLSCCHLGRDVRSMLTLLRTARLRALWTYSRLVLDRQCHVVETALYWMLFAHLSRGSRPLPLREIHHRTVTATELLRVDATRTALAEPLLRMYVPEMDVSFFPWKRTTLVGRDEP